MKGPLDHTYGDDALIDSVTDKMLVVGWAILEELGDNPESSLSRAVFAYLDDHLDDPHERALFGYAPLLDYDDTLKPFKPRPAMRTPQRTGPKIEGRETTKKALGQLITELDECSAHLVTAVGALGQILEHLKATGESQALIAKVEQQLRENTEGQLIVEDMKTETLAALHNLPGKP